MRDRPRRPARAEQTSSDPGYPSLAQEGVTRRAFLGAALGAGAAATLDVVSVDPAEARGRLRGRRVVARHRYTVPLPRIYRCPRSGVVVSGVHGRTSDERLGRFLQSRSNRRALVRIIRRVLRAHRREPLNENRVRWAVEREIITAFKRLFQRSSRRPAGYLMLRLSWRPPSTS